MMTPATPNRFQAVLAAVRAGDDQARREAETARARRADHWFNWWYGARRDTISAAGHGEIQRPAPQERAA